VTYSASAVAVAAFGAISIKPFFPYPAYICVMYKFEVDRLWSFAVSAETSRSQLHSAVPRHDRRQQCRQRTEAGREGKLRPARRTGQ